MKRTIFLLTLALLAVIFALGSVGAYDHGNIGFLQCSIQVGICTLVEWFALKCLNA